MTTAFHRPAYLCVATVTILLATIGCAGRQPSFVFLATGDAPYSEVNYHKYSALMKHAAHREFDFLLHVGDIKSGGAPCTDEAFFQIRDLFRAHPVPVVYTPGDNEWTDCRAAGPEWDPIERLERLREIFFEDRSVLRLASLDVHVQGDDSRFEKYIENYRFLRARVLFICVHAVGSGNNMKPDDPASMQEYQERNRANLAFLEESFDLALTQDVAGVAVIIHANPDFETGSRAGHRDFVEALRDFLTRFEKPVLCINGDTHSFRIDSPLRQTPSGAAFPHFTRLEVFGAPVVAGVEVTVDPSSRDVFSFLPYRPID